MTDLELFQLALLAAINAGWPVDDAEDIANSAVDAVERRFGGDEVPCH